MSQSHKLLTLCHTCSAVPPDPQPQEQSHFDSVVALAHSGNTLVAHIPVENLIYVLRYSKVTSFSAGRSNGLAHKISILSGHEQAGTWLPPRSPRQSRIGVSRTIHNNAWAEILLDGLLPLLIDTS
jgi:hypothetical protein